jgi:hypothetical protein
MTLLLNWPALRGDERERERGGGERGRKKERAGVREEREREW